MKEQIVNGIRFLKSVSKITEKIPANPHPGLRLLMSSGQYQNFVIEFVDNSWVKDPLYPHCGVLVEEQDSAFTYGKDSSHKFKWFKSVSANSLAKLHGMPHSLHQMSEVIDASKGISIENGKLTLSVSPDAPFSWDNPDSNEASLSFKSELFVSSEENEIVIEDLKQQIRDQEESFNIKIEAILEASRGMRLIEEKKMNVKLNEILIGKNIHTETRHVPENGVDCFQITEKLYIAEFYKEYEGSLNHNVENLISIEIDGIPLAYGRDPVDGDYYVYTLHLIFFKAFSSGSSSNE